ncbi:mechanosensitive ion channel [Raphidocelis subcapitata]|uniref:Mechanosensitive ion channel n=1 Tax=Raphidocelis subcapitata TaxID=307507 RepID=A0A2V0P3L3_9CHLO|nr:mechanosensitive ion channel [Raphidocelis subcapitata]|eukprot:GBF92443.1 mechanosensitive ion channel [Raphidocelis subcapitata]
MNALPQAAGRAQARPLASRIAVARWARGSAARAAASSGRPGDAASAAAAPAAATAEPRPAPPRLPLPAMAAAAVAAAASALAPPAAHAARAAAAALAPSPAAVAPLDWAVGFAVAHIAVPVAFTWLFICALNHLANKAEQMPNPDGVSITDVAPRALRGPAVGALAALLVIRLARNISHGIDQFVHLYSPHYGPLHDTIEPILHASGDVFTALDSILLRLYAAVAVLFAAWAAAELKDVAVGLWLRSSSAPGRVSPGLGSAAVSVEGEVSEVVAREMGVADATARRELRRAVLPLSSLASWAIFAAGIALALNLLGVNILPLLTVGGASTIVVGLASQQLLANALNGVSLFFSRPFITGESVTLQQGAMQISGTVLRVTPMRTLLRDADGVVISLPNKVVSEMVIYNRSRNIAALPPQLGHVLRQPLRVRMRVGAGQPAAALAALRAGAEARLAEAEKAGVVEHGTGGVALGRITDSGVELLLTATLLTSEFGFSGAGSSQLALDLYALAAANGASCATM